MKYRLVIVSGVDDNGVRCSEFLIYKGKASLAIFVAMWYSDTKQWHTSVYVGEHNSATHAALVERIVNNICKNGSK